MDRATLEAAALAALGQACHSCAHLHCQSNRSAAGRVLLLEPAFMKEARVNAALKKGPHTESWHIQLALDLRDEREAREAAT